MPSSQFSHKKATTIGPCKVAIKDGAHGFAHLFKMDNVALRRNVESAEASETIDNVKRVMRKAQIGMNLSVSGDIMESNNPDVIKLLYGISDTEQMVMLTQVIETRESFNAVDEDAVKLLHPHTIVSTLPEPTTCSIALSGTGSTLTPGDWYIWITCSYGPGDLHHSAPIASIPSSVTVADPPLENIQVDWTAPVVGNPHHYTIWASQTNNIDTAQICATVSGSFTYIITADPTGSLYTATSTEVMTVFDYETGLTQYIADTDFYFDSNLGTIRRLSGGAIPDGQRIEIDYHYTASVTTGTDIGPGKLNPTTVWLRLHQLQDDKDADGNDEESGLIIDLYNVDITSGDAELPFSEGEFMTGISIEWDCMVDRGSQTFGAFRVEDSKFEHWQLINSLGACAIEGEGVYPPGDGAAGDLGSGGLSGGFGSE